MAQILLAHFEEGASGITSFGDSTSNSVITGVNGAIRSEVASKYGTGSLYLDGVNDHATVVGGETNYDFSTGDYSFDAWIRPLNTATGPQTIIDISSGTEQIKVFLSIYYGDLVLNLNHKGATANRTVTSTAPVMATANTWYHIECSRVTGVIYLFVDGVLCTFPAPVDPAQSIIFATTPTITIGSDIDGITANFGGYIDEVQIKTSGGHTSAFTVSSIPYDPPFPSGILGKTFPLFTVTSDPIPGVDPNLIGRVGTANLSISPTLTGAGIMGKIGNLIQDLPAPTTTSIIYSSKTANLDGNGLADQPPLPMLGATGEAYISAMANANISFPSFFMDGAINSPSDINLPTISVTTVAYIGKVGDFFANLPLITSDAAAVATHTAESNTSFRIIGITGAGLIGKFGSANINLPVTSFIADFFIGKFASDVSTLPNFTTDGVAFVTNYGSLNITLPIFRIEGRGNQTLSDTFHTLAMTLFNTSISEYQNFGFTSFADNNIGVLASNSQGLFILGGDKDNLQDIVSVIKTAAADFKSQKWKKLSSATISYRCNGSLNFSTITDETIQRKYPMAPYAYEGIVQHRPPVHKGKGIKAKYWQFVLENVQGSDFDLDDISLEVTDLGRTAVHRSK